MSAQARTDELLVQRAIEGLTEAEEGELAALLGDTSSVAVDRFELAAALVTLATLDPRERMPESLAQSLLSRAISDLE
jgi:hypothetical protein